jgi:hypothetical protein
VGFVCEGTVDLAGYNLGDLLFLGIQSVFDHCPDELDFDVWVVGLQGRLDNVIRMVMVMKACVHVADKLDINNIIGGGKVVCLDPNLVVAKPDEKTVIVFHQSKGHGACDFHEERDGVRLGVVLVLLVLHLLL